MWSHWDQWVHIAIVGVAYGFAVSADAQHEKSVKRQCDMTMMRSFALEVSYRESGKTVDLGSEGVWGTFQTIVSFDWKVFEAPYT